MIRQAMILAAGLGKRMRPLTEGRAKPTLTLMNRPILLHLLDQLDRHGFRRVTVNTHHAPETIERALEGSIPDRMDLTLSHEPGILGTGGGLVAARARFDPGGPILVLNADSLSDADPGRLVEVHVEASAGWGALATLAVRDRQGNEPYSPVFLDREGRISGIGDRGRPGRPVTFIGLHVLSAEALDRLPPAGLSDIVRDAYMPILDGGGSLAAREHPGWWVEIGNPALYRDAHLQLLGNPGFVRSLPAEAGRMKEPPGAAFLGPGCRVSEGLSLIDVVAGPGCTFGEKVSIAGSVLGRRVSVGRGATIERSVIGDRVSIPAGSVIRSRLIMISEEGGPPRDLELP